MICSDDVDEDFLDDEEGTEWEDACCEDPYWEDDDDDADDEEDEDEEREWCD